MPRYEDPPAEHLLGLLDEAATDLDQVATSTIIAAMLRTQGVVTTWTDVLAPALRLRGERFEDSADGIHIEHLLSECIRAALSAVAWRRRRRWNRCRPALLAAPDGEQHVLALHALEAALAEVHQRSVLLGASVPPRALDDAAVQLDPGVIFLWSHTPDTAAGVDLAALRHPRRRDPSALVLGGPGWPRRTTELVTTLAGALRACTAPTLPSLDRTSVPDHPDLAS